MKTQLPAIIQFVRRNGDMGTIRQMESAKSVSQAASDWDHGVERAGVNDVHPAGLALATQIMSKYAKGGMVGRNGPVKMAAGGRVAGPSLQMQHDAAVVQYDHYLGLYREAVKKKNIVKEVSYGKLVARYGNDIHKIDAEMIAAKKPGSSPLSAAAEAKKLNAIKDPILRLVTDLKDTGRLSDLARQMEYHSLDPAPIGGLTHDDMAKLAVQVTPDVLNAIYGENTAALGGALKGGIAATGGSAYAGVFGQSTAASLSLLGKLSGAEGVHGIYAGVKFGQGGKVRSYAGGGVIPEPVIGWGQNSGARYSFAENGPETVVPNGGGTGQTNALLAALIRETRANTHAVQQQGTNFGRALNGAAARGASRGYYS